VSLLCQATGSSQEMNATSFLGFMSKVLSVQPNKIICTQYRVSRLNGALSLHIGGSNKIFSKAQVVKACVIAANGQHGNPYYYCGNYTSLKLHAGKNFFKCVWPQIGPA
jgi:hypothetical protein